MSGMFSGQVRFVERSFGPEASETQTLSFEFTANAWAQMPRMAV